MINRLEVLSTDGGPAQEVRGLADPRAQKELSAAVVIGIGGSGIQTISRLRSAVVGDRPDQTVRASIRFLGIDAVVRQEPPLPPGVNLGTGEFLNLTEVPFDAGTFIRSQQASDPALRIWWDPDYKVPPGPLTEGLKRERMLGRLAFFKESARTTMAVANAMNEAIDIGGFLELGTVTGTQAPRIPVYIVASSCGGTGSAGFLEVVFSVWSAARVRGFTPEIRAFIYLPGAFEAAVLQTPNGEVAAEAQRANAYAFFREVDHFLAHGSQFAQQMGQDTRHGGPVIDDRELLQQVYLMDGIMQNIGTITQVTDLYEITSEAIYQFLLTDAGRPLVTVDATNTDAALAQLDRWDKPRRYCSLGIARVVFPEVTYNYHLTARYADWFIDDALLISPPNLTTYVQDHDVTQQLDDRLPQLFGEVRRYVPEEEVQDFLELADRIPGELSAHPTLEEATKFRTRIHVDSAGVLRSMQRTLDARSREQARAIERAITDAVLGAGEGLPFAIEVMRRAQKVIDRTLTRATSAGASEAAAAAEAEARVGELIDELSKAVTRKPHERLLAAAGSAIGKARTVGDVVEELGPALRSWAQAIHDGRLAQSEADFLRDVATRSGQLRQELERCQEALRALSDRARTFWQQDQMLGKDAGPLATTTLIPADVLPEVERSRFALKWFSAISKEHSNKLQGVALAEFVNRWVTEATNRGFFSLGSADPDERRKAELTLLEALNRDAEERALHRTDERGNQLRRLPETVEAAAAEAEEVGRLDSAIKNLEELSRHVCWSWDQGRFQLSRPGEDVTRQAEPRPAVTSVVLYDKSTEGLVKTSGVDRRKRVLMKDPHRIIALSVEWGVPVHALHTVDRWRVDYDRVQARRRSDPSSLPPAHIDRRWGDYLEPLTPEYGERDLAVDAIARAFAFAGMLNEEEKKTRRASASRRSADGPIASLFMAGRGNQPTAPIARHPSEDRWVGRVLDLVDGGSIRVRKDTIDLGRTWQDLVTRVAEETNLQDSINAVTGLLVSQIGASQISDAAQKELNQLSKAAANRRLPPKEREAISHIVDGAMDLLTDLDARISVGQ